LVFRFLDVSSDKENPSKSCTIQQYLFKWQGPTFFIHYKYSSMLNVTFITMVFGTGMPILFPVAACTLFMLYTIETFKLFYGYKRPPVYDTELNNYVLKKLLYAPFVLLAFGFWELSNPALQGNYDTLNAISKSDDPQDFGHYW